MVFIDWEITTTVYFSVPGTNITDFDIFPDFIGVLLIFIGSLYLFSQYSIFSKAYKLVVIILPITAYIMLVNSIIDLFASGSRIPAIWNDFTLCTEVFLYLSIIGIGWKLANIYSLSVKKSWKITFALECIVALIVLISLIISLIARTIKVGATVSYITNSTIELGQLGPFAPLAYITLIILVIATVVYFLISTWRTKKELQKKIKDEEIKE